MNAGVITTVRCAGCGVAFDGKHAAGSLAVHLSRWLACRRAYIELGRVILIPSLGVEVIAGTIHTTIICSSWEVQAVHPDGQLMRLGWANTGKEAKELAVNLLKETEHGDKHLRRVRDSVRLSAAH